MEHPEHPPATRHRILVAGGDRPPRESVRRVLAERGHEVVVVSSGDAALARLDGDRFDQAVIDWHLPGMSGPELCRRIRSRSHLQELHVLLLTDREGREAVSAAVASGADDFLGTPFSLGELVSRVQAGLRLRRLQAEVADGRRHLEAVIDALAEGVVTHSTSGAIVTANAAAERILGLTHDQLLGWTSMDPRWRATREDGADYPGEEHPAMVTLRTGEGVRDAVMGVDRPDGSRVWISINTRPLRDAPGGAVTGVVTSFADITAQRRAVDDATRAHERMEGVLRAAIDYSIIGTDPDGTITTFNAGAERMLGYRASELLGRETPAIIHDEAEVAARAAQLGIEPGFEVFVHAAREGRSETREWTYIRRDGRRLTVRLTVSAVRGESGEVEGFIGIAEDVSELAAATRELSGLSTLHAGILSAVTLGLYGFDVDGRITFVNPAAARITGHEVDDLIGRDSHRALHHSHADGSDFPREQCPLDAILRTERAMAGETVFWRRDGSPFPARYHVNRIERDGVVTGGVVAFEDTSEQARAAAALRRSQERFRVVSTGAPIGIFHAAGEGRCEFVNDELTRMAGRPPEELMGAGLREALHPEDRRWALAAATAAFARGETFDEEIRLVRPGGETVWTRCRMTPVRDVEGRLEGVVGTHIDITEQHRHEAEGDALRRVATAIASDAEPARVFALVAEQVATMLEADASAVLRVADGAATPVGQWVRSSELALDDLPIPLDASMSATSEAVRERRPARHAEASGRVSVAAPIHLHGELWGTVGAMSTGATSIPRGAERRLGRFVELLEVAVASAEARRRLLDQATRDPLTELWNHRVFHENLALEVAQARRFGTELTLVLIDLDHFKRVNDTHGHEAGDRVLREFARLLRERARESDVVARVGGEEFAWLMTGCDPEVALSVAETLRAEIAEHRFPLAGGQTASFGVAGLRERDASALFRAADSALYLAKLLGRNRCAMDGTEEHIAEAQGHRHGTGSPASRAVGALSWSIEARDDALAGHAERTADLAVAIASAGGWSPERAAQLREAALVHDIAKPSAAAHAADGGPPDREEREERARRAAEGARVLTDILTAEQVSWVRHHEERPDGSGRPDGLSGAAVPEGAMIIGLAEAMDVLVTGIGSAERLSPALALERIGEGRGRRFPAAAVDALERLVEAGALGPREPVPVADKSG